MRRLFLFIIAIVILGYGGWKVAERRHYLSFAPCGMDVSGIAYMKNEAWGIGLPGDNETGIVVYRLPGSVAEAIEAQGIDYFRTLKCDVRKYGRRGQYRSWLETPVAPDRRWGEQIKVSSYLNRYGFGIPVRRSVEVMVDQAISAPGAFYAYGRIGTILVIPTEHRAVFMYAG
ncbi:MAG: hypothetical protein M9895_02935 [Aquamicrobium sp.]|uniref:hypothetical protein n=1 Tax=Aquamicrobium sp. TaxID=1872579 RepID=UPI00349E59F2|nr:hypothetical protein [Aquamicrobium sp.]MCO5159339.1 hypothetical protein [Aquamicrobium sp.]